MVDRGRIRYAHLAGTNIAYRVIGEGPVDVVVVLPVMMSMESLHRREVAEFFDRLASFSRVVVFDRRGFGLSDRMSLDDLGPATAWADDIGAVMEATSIERASVIGFLGGGQISIAFTTAHPDRVNHLILMHTFAKQSRSDDFPWGFTPEMRERNIRLAESGWEDLDEADIAHLGSGYRPDEYREFMQRVAGPAQMAELQRKMADVDVRDELERVTCPTLILHRRDNTFTPAESARFLAQKIPGATLVELPGAGQSPFRGSTEAITDEIEYFITGRRPARIERALFAVLFTDIVGSTDIRRGSATVDGRTCLQSIIESCETKSIARTDV